MGADLDGISEELKASDPDHGSSCKPQADGSPEDEVTGKHEDRDGNEGLGHAGENGPQDRPYAGDSAGHQDEGHSEALWDIMHGERCRDEGSKVSALAPSEGDADAETLGEGVESHDSNHEEHLAEVLALELPKLEVLVPEAKTWGLGL